ncbi:MAG: hypothetical protein NTW45_01790 [Rhodocyclales bacterium]|nr:hypothetical protein [Rhodocyclales bacterium]
MNPPSQFEANPLGDPQAAAVTPGQLAAVIAFAAVCLGFHWFSEQGWVPLLDSANLALHEAGHPLVGIFSTQATVYGGTLFQLGFPAAIAVHFHRAANPAGVAGAMVWLGENLLNVARYMADARVQELPLVGNGDHDWAEIFWRWGVLRYDGRIASITRGIGLILMVVAMVWLYRRWQESRESA